MKRKLLIPRQGVLVRDPITGAHYPAEGLVRNLTTYEDRRIKDGDLEVRDVPVKKNAKKNNKDGEK